MPLDDVPAEESVYDAPPAADDLPPDLPEEVFPAPVEAVYAPYDPGNYSAAFGTPPKVETKPCEPSPQGTTDAPPDPVEFDSRWKAEFEGLLYVGALTSQFNYLGHRFLIRTLTQDELLEVTLAVKEYTDSDAYTKANMMALVAASTISVDGRPMPMPVTLDSGDTPFQNRWRYVRATWYPPVIDFVFKQYVELEWKVREVIEAMGKASG